MDQRSGDGRFSGRSQFTHFPNFWMLRGLRPLWTRSSRIPSSRKKSAWRNRKLKKTTPPPPSSPLTPPHPTPPHPTHPHTHHDDDHHQSSSAQTGRSCPRGEQLRAGHQRLAVIAGGDGDGEGAARRRRERRVRSWLRHERQSVAMALSDFKHHSSRGQRKDRTGEEGHRDKYEAPRRQKPPPPQGSRPPCLGEPRGPQARIQQRTMEQLADVVPMVQILDTPVPQMVEQLPDVLRFFATLLPVPEDRA